ncbi:MAG: hypothetical protein K8U57_15225 [Planctomycetes bacterium]|nr:hypothetical protein [Planctomycetota bacterium]
MTPNQQEPETNASPQEDDTLSAEDEAYLAELEKESLGGGVPVDIAVGVESCLTCSIIFILLLAVAKYFFS